MQPVSTTVLINGVSAPDSAPKSQFLFLGCGKSAFFFASLLPPMSSILTLTHHPAQSDAVSSAWGYGPIPFPQSDKIAEAKEYIRKGIVAGKPTTIVMTTDPARGKYWFDQLMADEEISAMIAANPDKFLLVLPQSPNPFLERFSSVICAVQLDYYPGIGGVIHDATTRLSTIRAGVKEETTYALADPAALSTEQKSNLQDALTHLCANQRLREVSGAYYMNLLPTNALLHTVGMVVHVAAALVQKGLADKSLMEAKSSKEFFAGLTAALKDKKPEEIDDLLKGALVGKGFYREMPHIGPNVLMKELSDKVVMMRSALVDAGMIKEADKIGKDGEHADSHIFNHLRGKYAQQYEAFTGRNAYEVSFGEFINNNPPYQNPGIVVPTKPDGSINGQHRFFTEELPTMRMLMGLGKTLGMGKEELEIFAQVIGFNEMLSRPGVTPEVKSGAILKAAEKRSKL